MLDIGEYMGLEYIKGLIRGGESAWLLFQLTLETKIREILVPRKRYMYNQEPINKRRSG